MKLKTRIILSMGAVFVFFSIALGVALSGMQSNKSRFEHFIEQDLALAQAGNSLYSQGLQMGQALRNVVMDPANRKAYKNLDEAAETFNDAGKLALKLAADSPADLDKLQAVMTLREQQSAVQAKITALAATDQAAAIAMVSRDETPIWRQMRAYLLDFTKAKRADVDQTKADMIAFSQRMLMISLAFVAVALAAATGIAFWLVRSIMKQLGGEPEYAVEVAHAISAGDFSKSVNVAPGDTSSLLFSMNTMRENLTATIRDIRHATETIAVASGEIATGNLDLSNRTESQASSLEETASSMEQLTSAVKQNADNAREANRLVASTSAVAVKGGEVVGEVVETMASIKDSSRKIADITSVIDGIAFQTNILALNAAVEAARAGEQGRGFAVVASEVRSLAQRSASAAKEIKELIEDSVGKVDTGGKLVDEAGKTMGEIVASVKHVTDIMGEIASASQEQSAGIEQVNQAITHMDDVTQQNSALVEEAAAATESLRDQTGLLVQAVSMFRLSEGGRATRGQPANRSMLALPGRD